MSVYVSSAGAFLPGPPVDNDTVETILGQIHGRPSRLRRRVLKSNGIRTRHYALDPEQRTTHQNEEMAAAAIASCLSGTGIDAKDVPLLAIGSTQGDLSLPGLASMVQARAGFGACEILTTHGICSAGVMALKAAFNAMRAGDADTAVVCASELASRNLKHTRYEAANAVDDDGRLDFDSEFLRWMLSDGAGALLLRDRPNARGLSLRVDWIRLVSHANSYPVCMWAGRSRRPGALPSWQDYPTFAEAEADGALLLRQDMRLLDEIVKVGVDGFLRLIEEGLVVPGEVDHLLCHYSSHYFKGKIARMLEMAGAMIPESRWFTNLYEKGNTGCAAIFIMLEEFIGSGRLNAGDRVLCVVPESGRFSAAYVMLTAVGEEAK